VGGRCFAEDPATWVKYYNSLGLDFVAPDIRGVADSVPRLDCPDDPDALRTPSIACAKYYATKSALYGCTPSMSNTPVQIELSYSQDNQLMWRIEHSLPRRGFTVSYDRARNPILVKPVGIVNTGFIATFEHDLFSPAAANKELT